MTELTTDVLLFGTEPVTDEINSSIFKAVQKIISLLKRFCHYFNKIMLLVLDNHLWILRPMTKKYFGAFILCARCLNSTLAFQ